MASIFSTLTWVINPDSAKCWRNTISYLWETIGYDLSSTCLHDEFLTLSYLSWNFVAITFVSWYCSEWQTSYRILTFQGRARSGITHVGIEKRIAPNCKLNAKTGIPLSLYFGFNILLLFSGLLFLRFSKYFPVILELQYSHPYLDSQSFLDFFLFTVSWVPTVVSKPFSTTFSPWAQFFSFATEQACVTNKL